MSHPPERRWLRVLVGYLVFLLLLATALAPIYSLVESPLRPTVVRLGGALVVGIALVHLRRILRQSIDAQPSSGFEAALHPAPPEPRRAPLYVKLRDELGFSGKSQAYFEHVLWPRIVRLSALRAGQRSATAPVMPRGRRLFRRGPSLTALRNLIRETEVRP